MGSLRSLGNLVKAEVYREYLFAKRYAVEVGVRLFTVYAFFLVLFLVSKSLGGPEKLGALGMMNLSAYQLVGFAMWLFSLMALGAVSDDIAYGSQMGVLEAIWLTPHAPLTIVCVRALIKGLYELLFLTLFVGVGMMTTGIRLAPRILPALAVLAITLAGLFGLGLLFGGLALVYKRIGPVTSIVRTSFLFLTGALVPLSVLPEALKTVAVFLPMTDGVALIQGLLVDNAPLQDVFGSVRMLRCLLNAIAYLSLGILAFWGFERKARKEGLLAVY